MQHINSIKHTCLSTATLWARACVINRIYIVMKALPFWVWPFASSFFWASCSFWWPPEPKNHESTQSQKARFAHLLLPKMPGLLTPTKRQCTEGIIWVWRGNKFTIQSNTQVSLTRKSSWTRLGIFGNILIVSNKTPAASSPSLHGRGDNKGGRIRFPS